MTIIKDQEHYIEQEPKPEFIETKGFKYQIFKDHVRFILLEASPGEINKELRVPFFSLNQIVSNVNMNENHGYYTGQCIDCHKFDALVKGYCKPCADKEGTEYDKV